uniref:Hexosyltransferase n=2 Tax=Ornithodoros turicata TaxID=34597 RepID=A0A2R5LNB2_9ACAR
MFFKTCFLTGFIFVSTALLIFTVYNTVDEQNLVVRYDAPFYLDGWFTQEMCDRSKPLEVLFFVHTALEHSSRRNFYRETLQRNSKIGELLRFSLVFFVGQSNETATQAAVEEEAKKYGDVVIFPFLDTYRNLTYKFVYGLKWVNDHCRKSVKYVVKIDDDALVNIFVLVEYLRTNITHDTGSNSIHCLTWKRTRAVRNKHSKWFVTRREYPSTFYPTYCGGVGYILPSKILPRLLSASHQAPFLWIDDIYSTGILARVAKIGHVKIDTLYELFPNETGGGVRSDVAFTHLRTPQLVQERYKLWDELLRLNNFTNSSSG